MTEANWGDDAMSPKIDWRMSASLECVQRGDNELAEVTSLAEAVSAWLALDSAGRATAVLTPERPLVIGGVTVNRFNGDGISALADRLPRDDPSG